MELQAEDDQRCPNGHPMDESVGDDGPAYRVAHFTCEACAAVATARRTSQKDMASAGEAGDDLLDGRYWVALPDTEGGTS